MYPSIQGAIVMCLLAPGLPALRQVAGQCLVPEQRASQADHEKQMSRLLVGKIL